MRINTQKTKDELRKIFSDYAKDYQIRADASYKHRLTELKHGEIAPARTGFFYSEDRAAFDTKAHEYRDKALEVIETLSNEIRARKTDAPSTDAINYVSLLRSKKGITEQDINDALDRYGSNYSVYNAIRDLASDNRIYIQTHVLDNISEGIDNTVHSINKMSASEAERGHATDGTSSVFNMTLEMNIPNYEE